MSIVKVTVFTPFPRFITTFLFEGGPHSDDICTT